jgi:altronate dehydratase small subunit
MSERGSNVDAVMLDETDNVATALRDLTAGETVRIRVGERLVSRRTDQAIAYGHKLAVEKIACGAMVRKYGEVIGRATRDIAVGTHVHIHNVESLRGRGDLEAAGNHHGI